MSILYNIVNWEKPASSLRGSGQSLHQANSGRGYGPHPRLPRDRPSSDLVVARFRTGGKIIARRI